MSLFKLSSMFRSEMPTGLDSPPGSPILFFGAAQTKSLFNPSSPVRPPIEPLTPPTVESMDAQGDDSNLSTPECSDLSNDSTPKSPIIPQGVPVDFSLRISVPLDWDQDTESDTNQKNAFADPLVAGDEDIEETSQSLSRDPYKYCGWQQDPRCRYRPLVPPGFDGCMSNGENWVAENELGEETSAATQPSQCCSFFQI